MEMWRAEAEESQQRPKVLDSRIVFAVFLAHIAFFVSLWVVAWVQDLWPVKPEETIPIDLTVVVVENLEGNPDEPPPLKKPEPEPPPPPPKPQPKPRPKEPEKPKELDKIVTNIVKKVEKEEKKPEVKKPEAPKKTAKELREEKLKRMRDKATNTKERPKAPPSPPQPNGRTDRKLLSDAEIQQLLNAGYRPGSSTNLAASEEQLCYSLIKRAFEEKWDEPPWTDTLKPMVIRVWFGGGGRIVNFRLEQSSGDPSADATIKSAASRVGAVRGLTPGFVDKYRSGGVPVRFTVKPK